MGLFGPRKSAFEASVTRKGGKIVAIDSVKLSAKEIKKLEALERRKTEGEKGYRALAAGVKDIMKGHGDSRHSAYGAALMQEAKQASHAIKQVEAQKLRSPSDYAIKGRGAIPIKDQMHPKAYQDLLHREAKRQGLL